MAQLRLAHLLASFSQVADLGMGQPPETAMRACLLATGLARRMRLTEREVSDVYYTTLLQHVGCTAFAHETAALFGGDDIAVRAAADAYQAMTQERAYRPARTPDEAASELGKDADEGRLDRESVRAVLEVAGHAPFPSRRDRPAGLTEREVQVLRLAVRGLSNRETGASLFISPKTVDHHIQHIYAKIGVSTRAGAAMYAMEHNLVRDRTPGQMG